MSLALAAVFWSCLGLCVYVYFGYPVLIALLARFRPRPVRRGKVRPAVSVLVAAHDEESWISWKVTEVLDQEYPPERLELIVASDGSSDATVERARRAVGVWEERSGRSAQDRVQVLDLPRRGKAEALDQAVRRSSGEILVFTDAGTRIDRGALVQLVENFADPEVGGVCGNQIDVKPSTADLTAEGESLYWRYDKWIKRCESRTGSIFASDGSLHALRRALWRPLEGAAGSDDILLSSLAPRAGTRLVFEPRAVVTEIGGEDAGREFRRKVRVTMRSVTALLSLGRNLWSRGLWSFELISHKLLRHLVPLFLLGMLVTNAVLALSSRFFVVVLVGQVAFYLLALVGFLARRSEAAEHPVLTVPYFFTFANLAALRGLLALAAGQRAVRWRPRAGLEDHDESPRPSPETS